jgi:hypothetical protein
MALLFVDGFENSAPLSSSNPTLSPKGWPLRRDGIGRPVQVDLI